MKKTIFISMMAALAVAGCKKKEATISTSHNYSVPVITMPGTMYYSIPVGGVLPVIEATAYDSFYHEDCAVVFDQTELDNTTPGVYVVTATAKNQYGMAASKKLLVAVTSISADINLAGIYRNDATDDTVNLTRLANGFYMTDDVAGNGAGDTSHVVPAYFVHTAPAALVMPQQDSKFGTFYGTDGFVNLGSTDTTYEYVIHNAEFTPTIRVFRRIW